MFLCDRGLFSSHNISSEVLCDRGTVLLSRNLFRSFMTRSNINYRTANNAPTVNDSIREAHSYEYDNNVTEGRFCVTGGRFCCHEISLEVL
jgi:hypothetical protein